MYKYTYVWRHSIYNKAKVLKSSTILYKMRAHISLLNVTFVSSCLLIYSI